MKDYLITGISFTIGFIIAGVIACFTFSTIEHSIDVIFILIIGYWVSVMLNLKKLNK